MSVEAKVFSPREAFSELQLRSATQSKGISVRLTDFYGKPLAAIPAGPLNGDFVILGWTATDAQTTMTVDEAIAAGDKAPIDKLGQSGQLGWCGFTIAAFNYERHWDDFPDEREEYEESLEPELLAKLKSCKTLYSLRSGTRPARCADLVDQLATILRKASDGVLEDATGTR